MLGALGLLLGAQDLRAEVEPGGAPEAEQPALAWNRTSPWYTYWAQQRERWFASSDLSLGFTQSVRATFAYGRPFWQFAGVEAHALTTSEFGAISLGPRIDALYLNGLVALRGTRAYNRKRPVRAERYDTFDAAAGPVGRYWALDASLWTYVPAGRTLTYLELSYVYVLNNQTSPYALFEEYHRVTLNGSSGLVARSIVGVGFFQQSLRIGPVGELVLTPDRSSLLRVGGSIAQRITEHLGVTLAVTVPVISPDGLDAFTQSWGIARVTYSFATGEPLLGL